MCRPGYDLYAALVTSAIQAWTARIKWDSSRFDPIYFALSIGGPWQRPRRHRVVIRNRKDHAVEFAVIGERIRVHL